MVDEGRADHTAPPGHGEPTIVHERPEDGARALIERLGIGSRARPTLVVCGGAEDLEAGALERADEHLGPAIAHAARACDATVVTGGTDAGIMRVVGGARRNDRRALPTLVGVAPRGRVEPEGPTKLEPHHTHAVLADSARWGGETPLLFDIAAALSDGSPVVVVLAAGGEHSRAEAREAVRRGWPLVILTRLGGIADDIADAACRADDPPEQTDPELRSLAVYDRLAVCHDGVALADCLTWELTDEPALIHAWRLFAAYDRRADELQRSFRRLERSVIGLGIVATALALGHGLATGWLAQTLHWILVGLPSFISLIVAYAGRRAFGKRWVLLRAAAEAVKAETFRYRTTTDPYVGTEALGAMLAARLATINRQLDGTEAVTGPLSRPARVGPPAGVDAHSLARLDPVAYVQHRVNDQVAFYHRRAAAKARVRDRLLLTTLSMGGAGTVLAAAGLEPAVALTTAVATGAASYLMSLQHERDIVTYNQSAAELEAAHLEWAGNRAADDAVRRLVGRVEAILTEEVGDWARRMARAMDDQTRRRT